VAADLVYGRARRHEAPVHKQNVGAVRQRVDGNVVVRLGCNAGHEGTTVEQEAVRTKRIVSRLQKGAEAEAQVVGGPGFHERAKAGHLVVFKETELHGRATERWRRKRSPT